MEHNGTGRPTILVVDDDPDIARMLVRMLSRLVPTAHVHAVLSGAQALDVLQAQRTDVVLTDLQMPGMDGTQVLQSVKARWPTTRVIVMSASAANALRQMAQAVQADAYLVKPFSGDEVAQALLPLLGG
jgi:CheY-like chemotaxis protein